MKRRERELHLPLDAGGPQDPQLRRLRDRPIEQRRLSDAGLSVNHQDPAVASSGSAEQATERLALALAAEQLISRRPREHPKL